MESGIESDQDDDRSSLVDGTRACPAAAVGGTKQTSSIDELIQLLMVPPPPQNTAPSVDVDGLSELVRSPPPSPPPTNRFYRRPQQHSGDDIYSDLVIPPPPSSRVNDAELDQFLAKIVACNGVVGPAATVNSSALNGLSVACSKYFGRQMSEPAHFRSSRLPEMRSTHTDNTASVPVTSLQHRVTNAEFLNHYRCASMANNVAGVLTNGHGYFKSIMSGSAWETPPATQASENARASTSAVTRRLEVDRARCKRLPLDSAATARSPTMPRKDDDVDSGGGTLTRRRRPPPPPPPPRTSSVQNSPALSCRSEQLSRRPLPPRLNDRLTPLPTSPASVRSALIRPGALRSSFAATKEPSPAASPPSPDWNFRRSQSLTETASATKGARTSLLAAIGSRLKSYWSPSTRRPARDRPSTATGQREHRRPRLDGPSWHSVATTPGQDDDFNDDTYMSFNINLTSRQLHASPTTSSFSSFTGE